MGLRAWNVMQRVNYIRSQESDPCDWHYTQACTTCATVDGLLYEKSGNCIWCEHKKTGNEDVLAEEKVILHKLMFLEAQKARALAVGVNPGNLPIIPKRKPNQVGK